MVRSRKTRLKRTARDSIAQKEASGLGVGKFTSHILGGAAMCTVLLLVSAGLSVLLQMLPLLTAEPDFLLFARVMHLFLLWSDGCLFVWWVLYSIVKRVKEWR